MVAKVDSFALFYHFLWHYCLSKTYFLQWHDMAIYKIDSMSAFYLLFFSSLFIQCPLLSEIYCSSILFLQKYFDRCQRQEMIFETERERASSNKRTIRRQIQEMTFQLDKAKSFTPSQIRFVFFQFFYYKVRDVLAFSSLQYVLYIGLNLTFNPYSNG